MALGAVVIVVVGILVVNYFKKPEEGEMVPANTTENAMEETAQKGQTHIVKSGETLWSIAEDAYGSGYNWVDIATENNIANPGVISEGQELSIPNVESKTATVMENNSEASMTDGVISGNSYTVVHGDSLWAIAVRAYGDGYKWVIVAEANNLENPNIIHAGNVLTLPR